MKRDITLVYKNHKFEREPCWHKCRAMVDFDIINADGKKSGEKGMAINISDNWLHKHGVQKLAKGIPYDLFCLVLSIAYTKIYSRGIIEKVQSVNLKMNDPNVKKFSAPGDCKIPMASES